MNTAIMVITIFLGDYEAASSSVTAVEFNSMHACQTAASKIQMPHTPHRNMIIKKSIVCVDKGVDPTQ